jgi:hypothetical protein
MAEQEEMNELLAEMRVLTPDEPASKRAARWRRRGHPLLRVSQGCRLGVRGRHEVPGGTGPDRFVARMIPALDAPYLPFRPAADGLIASNTFSGASLNLKSSGGTTRQLFLLFLLAILGGSFAKTWDRLQTLFTTTLS